MLLALLLVCYTPPPQKCNGPLNSFTRHYYYYTVTGTVSPTSIIHLHYRQPTITQVMAHCQVMDYYYILYYYGALNCTIREHWTWWLDNVFVGNVTQQEPILLPLSSSGIIDGPLIFINRKAIAIIMH